MRAGLIALLIILAPSTGLAQSAPARLGPFVREQPINGVKVSIPVVAELSPATADGSTVRIRTIADLSDLARPA